MKLSKQQEKEAMAILLSWDKEDFYSDESAVRDLAEVLQYAPAAVSGDLVERMCAVYSFGQPGGMRTAMTAALQEAESEYQQEMSALREDLAESRRINNIWIKQGNTGGWIDNLRNKVASLQAELTALRERTERALGDIGPYDEAWRLACEWSKDLGYFVVGMASLNKFLAHRRALLEEKPVPEIVVPEGMLKAVAERWPIRCMEDRAHVMDTLVTALRWQRDNQA
jgi:hypothetical protein